MWCGLEVLTVLKTHQSSHELNSTQVQGFNREVTPKAAFRPNISGGVAG